MTETVMEKTAAETELERREADRRDSFLKLPWWVWPFVTIVERVGFPILVAIFLGYQQYVAVPRVTAALTAVQVSLDRNSEAITSLLKTLEGRHK